LCGVTHRNTRTHAFAAAARRVTPAAPAQDGPAG